MAKHRLWFLFIVSILSGCVSQAEDVASLTLPASFLRASSASSLNRDDLLRFLSSSREWLVSDSSGALLAVPRVESTFASRLSQESDKCSFALRFSPYETSPLWLKKGEFTSAVLTDGHIQLALNALPGRERNKAFSSRLVLKLQENLWAEIYERSVETSRPATMLCIEALGHVFSTCGGHQSALDQILCDTGSVEIGNDEQTVSQLRVERTAPGEYQCRGFINPGKQGVIEIHARDVSSKRIQNEKKKHRTREWVGWSTNRHKRFYFDVPLTVDGDGASKPFEVLIQFFPAAPSLLYSTNCILETWTR